MGTEGSDEVDIENGNGAIDDHEHAGCIWFARVYSLVNGERWEGMIGDVRWTMSNYGLYLQQMTR